MIYWLLFQKSFLRNMQYRLAHLINNAASAIFGFVFMAVWVGVLTGKESGSPYSIQDMVHYIGTGQVFLWLTVFLTAGLNIQNGVRSGAITMELARPVHYFSYVTVQEAGRIAYNLLFRSIPIALVYVLTVGFYVPENAVSLLYIFISAILAIFISLNLTYLVGISSIWTTEISWAHFVLITLLFGFGGQLVPIDLLPKPIYSIVALTPFPCVLYYPVMMYLEKAAPHVLLIQASWAAALTMISFWVTNIARSKIEIQGG
ncbi:ABC transporter permease [Fictibacillus aquaticus]|uniref:ABC transporter permease n=1 Tax=Fictibacillus aquaticus TaxID=2021314 RepID=A0A235FE45_9BACL|nr:ABC transporter permease [Fictibacillus aquaticus]OYD59197.1 ABC transporter permease [Fictibacillus aquaticus]